MPHKDPQVRRARDRERVVGALLLIGWAAGVVLYRSLSSVTVSAGGTLSRPLEVRV